ncbi:alpha-galactosidase [Arthrobacter gandavensis]|uniref:alpha-galactosidase n=1 Tax=Arthrobacter gandavensis TaxID=169960 RepID=A0ABN2NSR9_9MICC|nr:alpha-galactosidase [Arthrobacter citreus]
MSSVILERDGTAVILDVSGLPQVLHWGAVLPGQIPTASDLAAPVVHSRYDFPVVANPLWPAAAEGWRGTPLVSGSRNRADASPRFRNPDVQKSGFVLTLTAEDADTALQLKTELELLEGGLLRIRNTLANTGSGPYQLLHLSVCLPVAPEAGELLDTTGRWTRERSPQRLPFGQGTWLREGRHGRTGHDAPVLLAAGTPGFGNRHGKVQAVHFAWSGNWRVRAERTPDPSRMLAAEELFGPGEAELAPGESYTTPWLYAAHSNAGLDGITAAFHTWLRTRPNHPRRPRPVVLNTWEAVYFDHNLQTLRELADTAAALGTERFVLDDGWFGGRRDDHRGLGDWTVSPEAWPEGLDPLISHVRGLGMEFGLWVEPEMISLDSDTARSHPEWICRARTEELPPQWRHQQVLDLTRGEAFKHVLRQLDDLLANHQISFLKWDQNRDLTDMASQGRPSARNQTLAAYRLMSELKARHPHVEIEACSSGGARVDLGVLEFADRVWASDSNDALERQRIQQWTQRLLPPELVGQHIGPPQAHTSGRTHSLVFRGLTALFGHFGMEWDIREAKGRDRELLAGLIALYKQHRTLIHNGTAVRADLADPGLQLYGAVAPDRSEALYVYATLDSTLDETPGRAALPGLDPEQGYRLDPVILDEPGTFLQRTPPAWLATGLHAGGAWLGTAGVPLPVLNPERAMLLHARRTEGA